MIEAVKTLTPADGSCSKGERQERYAGVQLRAKRRLLEGKSI